MSNLILTVDVEDWFQVENFKPWIPFASWGSFELRVERNTNALLDLFDACHSQLTPISRLKVNNGPRPCTVEPPQSLGVPGPTRIRATFFVLGWIADRCPGLIREIVARGHEVASHGVSHTLCNVLSTPKLEQELIDSKKRLEDIGGCPVVGFRAPSFSVDERLLAALHENGYRYDSSYNSFSLHGRYGRIKLNGQPRSGIAYRLHDDFYEIPLSNLPLTASGFLARLNPFSSHQTIIGNPEQERCDRQFHLPWGGGAYFRLMPLSVFKRGVRSILNHAGAYVFYMHPWEIDAGQPRVKAAGFSRSLRHYANLGSTLDRLRDLIETFAHCRFLSCGDYVAENDRTS